MNLYQELKPYLDNSAFIKELDNLLANKNKLYCSSLNLTTKALVVARAYEQLSRTNNILFVTSDSNLAEEYYEDLTLLLGNEAVSFLPDYETLPYEDRSPHYSIRAQRLESLTKIINKGSFVLVVSLPSFLQKIVSPKIIEKSILLVGKDIEITPDQLCSRLIGLGYQMETEVSKVGEISRRGGIIDIYPPSQKKPLRLEYFGDIIDSLRYFDPFTQRSTGEIAGNIDIIPAREVSLEDISTQKSTQWDKIHTLGFYDGIEQDVSLLYDETATVLDYLNYDRTENEDNYNKTVLILDEYNLLKSNSEVLLKEANQLYQQKLQSVKSEHKKSLIPNPLMIYDDFNNLLSKCKYHRYLFAFNKGSLPNTSIDGLEAAFSPQVPVNRDISMLQDIIETRLNDKWNIFIQSDNKGQSNRMSEMLNEFSGRIKFVIGVLHRGFDLPDAKLSLYTDHEIFNRYKQKKYQEYFRTEEALVDYESLKPGDYIVHIEHGIGLFEGLKLMTVSNSKIECLSIRYADNGRVYVPTFQLKLVTRYVSEEGIVPEIHKLGGKRWEQTKKRAKNQIEMVADDLIKLYAERSLRKGIAFEQDAVWQTELEESFIYEDTPDQKRATEEIKADMEMDTPMERLLCGDVGFGKTEVAVRAAFKAVTGGWQVAILVPTTLLAEQHYIVFKERLAQYPVNVVMLSRFRSSAEINKDLKSLEAGTVDIAIGTHRLLSKDVVFKKLGLLIIDEEHRFGVRHKEKIRKLKSNVDTLYMSATPIPRTLNMALVRLKEMSLMQTSPKARLPIRTNIIDFSPNIIGDAIKRELDRGGQILFIHNRIETIDSIAEELKIIVPKAKIVVGHGRLPEKILEKVMLDFYDRKYDILVATTIIESGIDIPNANTILINRADMFGLAQLYQIRGRVGRSNRRAYAYLIIPKNFTLSARKRLEALSEYNALGSGYQIAMKDLELRGAGSFLGTKQSGVINSVGFNYYNRLLSEAIENIKNGEKAIWNDEKADYSEKVRIDADFFFPENYIKDEKTRLKFYNRMISFNSIKQFDDIVDELTDRFGTIPPPAGRGISYFKLRLLTDKSNIKSFRIDKNKIIISFDNKTLPSKDKLQQVVSAVEQQIEFDSSRDGLKMVISVDEQDNSNKDSVLLLAQDVLTIIANRH